MSRAAPSVAGARAVLRELGLLARSGPFRIALVLSLILHLALLVLLGGQSRNERLTPLMRVRLVRVAPGPAAVDAAAPPTEPAVSLARARR